MARKTWLVLLGIFIIILGGVLIYLIFKNFGGDVRNIFGLQKGSENEGIENGEREGSGISSGGESGSGAETGGSKKNFGGGGGGAGGGSGGSGEAGGSEGGGSVWTEPYVELVKPKDTSSVNALVNYIRREGASLKIINEIGDNINVLIRLSNCVPEISDFLESDGTKDFVFSCSNSNFFDEDLFITYKIGEAEPITIFGIVRGSIR